MFAVIRNPIRITGTLSGKIESRHRTIEAARKAATRMQRACRRANGAATYLDLAVIEVAWSNSDTARGTVQAEADDRHIAINSTTSWWDKDAPHDHH